MDEARAPTRSVIYPLAGYALTPSNFSRPTAAATNSNHRAAQPVELALCISMFLLATPPAQPSPERLLAVEEATIEQRHAVSLRPQDASAYAELGAAYQRQRFQRAASEAWAVAVQLQPPDADAYRNYGMTVRSTGNIWQALRAYGTALQLRPNDGLTYFNRGDLLGAQERIDAFRHAVRHLPTHHGARSNLASSLRGEQRTQEANAVLRDWVTKPTRTPTSLWA